MPVIQCIVVQWRHISSESAVTYVFNFLVAKYDAKSKAWDILLVLTSVAGNLCNKCPSGYPVKECASVLCVSECCTSQSRPVQVQRPCPCPAAQRPRESAYHSGSFPEKLQGPGALTVPRDVPRRSTWPYSPPSHWNCAQAEKLHIYSVWKHLEKTLSWTFHFFYLTFKSKSLVFTFVSQEVSHIGFLIPVNHICLQIAFPVSHIGFTISPNFDNFTVKWNWRLICGWITATLCLVWVNIHFFP